MVQDPYKYFRVEARELLEGLSRGVLDLEKGAGGKETVGRLLRLAHTLKGASRVVKQPGIGDLAHAFEDSLGPFRDGEGKLSRPRIDELLGLIDSIRGKLSGLEPEAAPGPAPAGRPPGDEPFRTVRADLGELDLLLRGITQTGGRLAALAADLDGLARMQRTAARLAKDAAAETESRTGSRLTALAEELENSVSSLRRSVGARLEQAGRDLEEVRERSNLLRLLPAETIFPSLERAIRDAAQSLGRLVEFRASGGEIRLDAHVLGAVRDALLHAVRNAAAHGIEPEKDRLEAGKDPRGRVELAVERRGNRVTFHCRDDGRGIDLDAVRRAALRKGTLSAARAGSLSEDETIDLLLGGGLSTTGAITDLSGRGLGLEIVRETVSDLGGDLRVRTSKGRGVSVSLTVPVSLSSLPALLLESGGIAAAVPLDVVSAARRLAEGEIARSRDTDSVVHDGRAVPLMALSRILAPDRPPGNGAFRSILVVRSGDDHAALEVDRILGSSTVVVRPLPPWLAVDPCVAGAAVDSGGVPQVVLDAEGLVRAARSPAPRPVAKPARPLPILVVDDSLTTRMLEQSILESAGYDVDLAVSGEEGLSKAKSRRYGLYLVDVEMPGMDGFAFVEQTRTDPLLRDVPAILVTSRGSSDDRRRGREVGAAAYVVKSEFDQGRLLEIIGGLAR